MVGTDGIGGQHTPVLFFSLHGSIGSFRKYGGIAMALKGAGRPITAAFRSTC